MIFYHGSPHIVDKPKHKGSRANNDYGPAFYLTMDINQAKSWACKEELLGYVNKYKVRCDTYKTLKVLDLTNKDKYTVLNWLAILMHFRTLEKSFVNKHKDILNWLEKYYVDVDQYDVIIGFRADDAYFRFPIRFIEGQLSFEDLENVFKLGNLGIQYAFISKRAVDSLNYLESKQCESSYIGIYNELSKTASEEFDKLVNQPISISKTYILDLMRRDYEH